VDVRARLAWNVRRLRVQRGASQDMLAGDAELERAHVSRLERGTENPTILVLARIAKALDVDVVELLRRPLRGEREPVPLRAGRKKAAR
jgi:transcriptional regulator with XRE-family HTH domain